jgi:hypothetical protein
VRFRRRDFGWHEIAGTASAGQADFWRLLAGSYELCAGTAEQRGTNPVLVAMLRDDEKRYRQWADDAGAEEQGGSWWWLDTRQPSLLASGQLRSAS